MKSSERVDWLREREGGCAEAKVPTGAGERPLSRSQEAKRT